MKIKIMSLLVCIALCSSFPLFLNSSGGNSSEKTVSVQNTDETIVQDLSTEHDAYAYNDFTKTSVEITWELSIDSSWTLFVNGTKEDSGSGSGSYSYSYLSHDNGNDVEARVEASYTEDTIIYSDTDYTYFDLIYLDTVIQNLTPGNNVYSQGDVVNITFDAKDYGNSFTATLFINNTEKKTWSDDGSKCYLWDTSSYTGGTYYIEVDGTVSNDVTGTDEVYNDVTAKEESLIQNLAPSNQDYEEGKIVEVSFDLISGYTNYDFQLYIDGTSKRAYTSSGHHIYNWDSTDYTGEVTFNVTGSTKYYEDVDVVTNEVYLGEEKWLLDWNIKEKTGDTIYDESGSNRDGYYKTGTIEWRGGKELGDRSVYVEDGENLTNKGSFGNYQNISVMLWIKIPEGFPSSSTQRLFYGCGVEVQRDDNNNDIDFFLHDSGGSTQGAIFSRALPRGEWIHLAFTYDESTFRVYYNGNLKHSDSVNDITLNNNNVTMEADSYVSSLQMTTEWFSQSEIQDFMDPPELVEHKILLKSSDGSRLDFGEKIVKRNNSYQYFPEFMAEEGSTWKIDVYTLQENFITSVISSKTEIYVTINLRDLLIENNYGNSIYVKIKNNTDNVESLYIAGDSYETLELQLENYTVTIYAPDRIYDENVTLTENRKITVKPLSFSYHMLSFENNYDFYLFLSVYDEENNKSIRRQYIGAYSTVSVEVMEGNHTVFVSSPETGDILVNETYTVTDSKHYQFGHPLEDRPTDSYEPALTKGDVLKYMAVLGIIIFIIAFLIGRASSGGGKK